MTTREITFRKMEESLTSWEKGINRLSSQLKKYGVDTQVKYEDQLDQLTQRWQSAKEQLDVYGGSTEHQLSNVEAGFNRTLEEIQRKFVALVQQLNEQEKLPLGWAEGMAEYLSIKSHGWVEGQTTQPQTSEISKGWTEGLATKEPRVKSVGWAEGYHK